MRAVDNFQVRIARILINDGLMSRSQNCTRLHVMRRLITAVRGRDITHG